MYPSGALAQNAFRISQTASPDPARLDYPKHIHLKSHVFRFCFSHQQVEQRAVTVRRKFITMRVVEKFEAMFGQRLTGSIKDTSGFATCLFVERILVRNPAQPTYSKPSVFASAAMLSTLSRHFS